MRVYDWMRRALLYFAKRIMASRPPDFVVGSADNPYLRRWRVFPRNGIGNIYVHRFLRDDDDRALHDHPYANLSVVLENGYYEQLNHGWEPANRYFRTPGWVGYRAATVPHRVIVREGALPISLFFHGPRTRDWEFWCEHGWRPWQIFHGMNNPDEPNDSGGHQSGQGCQ